MGPVGECRAVDVFLAVNDARTDLAAATGGVDDEGVDADAGEDAGRRKVEGACGGTGVGDVSEGDKGVGGRRKGGGWWWRSC